MHILKSSNQSVAQTRNTLTNMKVTVKLYSMILTKLVSRARKMIAINHWNEMTWIVWNDNMFLIRHSSRSNDVVYTDFIIYILKILLVKVALLQSCSPELFYEIAALYPRAYLPILSIIVPNCRGVTAGGWWSFSMSLKELRFQVKSAQKIDTGKKCVKYAEILAFFDPYFPVHYMDRFLFVFSRILTSSENLSKYGEMRMRFCPYMGK